MLENLRKIIELFEWCSGWRINLEKSVLCGIIIDDNEVCSVAAMLNCRVEKLPLMYLGLRLGGYPKKESFWQPILNKVQGKLNKWKKYNLSWGGRSTLCKSVLSNLPTYYMSTFLMPEKVVSSLERSMRNFFWEGHKGGKLNHLVKWEKVTKDQKDGGLDFGSLKTSNLALLSRWGWWYLKDPNSLWCRVIWSRHGSGLFNWHTSGKENVSLRSPWISISRQWQKIEALAVFKMGAEQLFGLTHGLTNRL